MQRSIFVGPATKPLLFSKVSSPPPMLRFGPSIGLALREKSSLLKGKDTHPPISSGVHDTGVSNANELFSVFTIASRIALPRRRFAPPTPGTRPLDIFYHAITRNKNPPITRLVNRTDPSQILIFCNGIHRKHPNPGGLGIYFSFRDNFSASLAASEDGPGYTYNSANIQAVITALQLRDWGAEGFTKVVVACNVPYITDGVSGKAVKWEQQGWVSTNGVPISNREFWIDLLSTIEKLEKSGVNVQFWTINKADNLAFELSEIGMEPELGVEERSALEKEKKSRRQTVGYLLFGGAGFIAGLIALEFGY